MVAVSMVRCPDYDYPRVKDAIRRSLELIGGLGAVVKPGDKVLLKVNVLLGTASERAVTTHPAVVRAMAELVREAGGVPWVGDASGAYGMTGQALRLSGIQKASEEAGAELLNFEATGSYEVLVPGHRVLEKILVAKPVMDCDVLVSMPKMKTHQLVKYTGAVKNFFGIIPGAAKARIHLDAPSEERFSEATVDIFSVVKPRLAVMDGIVGMEGEGASNGAPINSGLILASGDCVALDVVASEAMGFNHKDIFVTNYAHARGLGVGELADIQVVGEQLSDVRINFRKSRYLFNRLPPFIGKFVMRRMENIWGIVMDGSKCTRCGICQKSCPPSAITMSPFPQIDKNKCIKCFCCHELCRYGAVELKTSLVGRLLLTSSHG